MSEQSEPLSANIEYVPMDILSTGIESLDTVLGGGIPSGSLILLVGVSGTGKTLLAQQLCFNRASRGVGRALYFSTLSEPHSKLVRQLQPFRFYDSRLLGDSVTLLALQDFLKQGVEATAEAIVRTARQQRASLVCLDGYRAIEAISQSELAARQFLYQLSSQLHLLGTTAVVTLERAANEPDEYGAYSIADGVIVCHYDVVGVRHRRKVEIRKLRMMAHLHGLHTYRIDTDGWTVFPRIEELVPAETTHIRTAGPVERLGFGIPEFDRLMDRGLPAGSTTLVVGEPASGKTLLSLHWLHEGLRSGEPALFLGFDERREQLLEKADSFGLALAEGEQNGLLSIRTFAPVENEPDEIGAAIRQAVATRGVRRLVIDGVFDLERAIASEDRGRDYFGALTTFLRAASVTSCMTKTVNNLGTDQIDFSETPVSLVAENLLWLRQRRVGGTFQRLLSVLAMRDGEPDQSVYEYVIGPGGLAIMARVDDAEE
jgi:circadian clock protein KaiC